MMTEQALITPPQKPSTGKTVLAVICLVLAAIVLCGAGISVSRVIGDADALNHSQTSLQLGREAEKDVRELCTKLSKEVDRLSEKLETLDFSDEQAWTALGDELKATWGELSGALTRLSEITGDDYSFLLESLPFDRWKEQLDKFLRRQVRENILDKILGEDSPLREWADSLLGGDNADFSISDELRRLADYDFIGELEKKVAKAQTDLIRDAVILVAEAVVAAGLIVAGVLLLIKRRQKSEAAA